MGIEIDKLALNTYIPRDSAEVNQLNEKRTKLKEDEEKKASKKQQKDDVGEGKNLDTYRKSNAVSNSIEKQIREQEAKIKELSDNLALLREDYNETGDVEDAARLERYKKERELYRKKVAENSLESIFESWTKKFTVNEDDKSILKQYNTSSANYDEAIMARQSADIAYDMADTAAYDAIQAHNSSSAKFLSGLWGKRDAYWDLARLQRRLAFAKLNEKSH